MGPGGSWGPWEGGLRRGYLCPPGLGCIYTPRVGVSVHFLIVYFETLEFDQAQLTYFSVFVIISRNLLDISMLGRLTPLFSFRDLNF